MGVKFIIAGSNGQPVEIAGEVGVDGPPYVAGKLYVVRFGKDKQTGWKVCKVLATVQDDRQCGGRNPYAYPLCPKPTQTQVTHAYAVLTQLASGRPGYFRLQFKARTGLLVNDEVSMDGLPGLVKGKEYHIEYKDFGANAKPRFKITKIHDPARVERFTAAPGSPQTPAGALTASLCATGLVVLMAGLVWSGKLRLNK